MGSGGPALSSAAFNAGVTALQTTLQANAQQRLTFERDRRNTSFTDKHGTHLAQQLYYLTNCNSDNGLPEIHQVLAQGAKSSAYPMVQAFLTARSSASSVPLTTANTPIASSKLVDKLFRSFKIAGPGQTFAS